MKAHPPSKKSPIDAGTRFGVLILLWWGLACAVHFDPDFHRTGVDAWMIFPPYAYALSWLNLLMISLIYSLNPETLAGILLGPAPLILSACMLPRKREAASFWTMTVILALTLAAAQGILVSLSHPIAYGPGP